jgi:hypothetical protein
LSPAIAVFFSEDFDLDAISTSVLSHALENGDDNGQAVAALLWQKRETDVELATVGEMVSPVGIEPTAP